VNTFSRRRLALRAVEFLYFRLLKHLDPTRRWQPRLYEIVARVWGWPWRPIHTEIEGRRFHFDPLTGIGKLLFLDGVFEVDERRAWTPFLPKTGTILDVGANIGYHTTWFATRCPTATVVAIEPNGRVFPRLLANIDGIPNVVAVNCGLADRGGLRRLHDTEDDAYSGFVDTHRKAVLKTTTVACAAGDEFLAALGIGPVRFIKIDVEGLEQEVLDGLKRTIAEHRPVIACEIFQGTHSNPAPDATADMVCALGYEAWLVTAHGLIRREKHDDRLSNYVFLPKGSPVPDAAVGAA
jgi:FkbM family methyltransferase